MGALKSLIMMWHIPDDGDEDDDAESDDKDSKEDEESIRVGMGKKQKGTQRICVGWVR